MKILVTGANGYLGKGIVKQLLNDGNEVIATDFRFDIKDNRATNIEIDLFSIEDPYSFFNSPDVVLHLAWRNGFVHDSISHFEDLVKHHIFIERLLASGLKHIAVLGTMHEIGFYEGCIKECTPTNPQNLYGIAKDALRNSTLALCKKNNAICQWIRGYYIVGTDIKGGSIFSKIIKANNNKQKTFPFTTGMNQYDFLDYEDFCNQVVKIVEQNKVNGIINACSGKPERLSERVERFIKENNLNIKLEYGVFPDRPYDSKAVWADDTKIKEILNEKNN